MHVVVDQIRERWEGRLPTRVLLPFILALSLTLNLWGNSWGAALRWHPDEITRSAVRMAVQQTLHPGGFPYGGLHTNTVLAGAVAPVGAYAILFDQPPDRARDAEAYEAWRDRQEARIDVLARSISGLLATLQVLLVYLIGSVAFGGAVGLLAALFLAVSPYFVGIAHFATVDTAANFWYWLSVFFAVLIWRRGHGAWYALGALTAGLAIGVKVDRLLAVLPLLTAHALRGEGLQFRKLLSFGLLVPAGYILANPYFLISPFEFLDGTARDLFFNLVRSSEDETSYLSMLINTKSGLGLPLFITAMVGVGYSIYAFVAGRDRAQVIMLLVAIIPYYLLFGSTYALRWYVPFLFPALALFAAYGCVNLIRAVAPRYAVVAGALVAVVVGFSLLKAIAFDLQFANDSRYVAAEWIRRHVPENATIGVGPRGPLISAERYRLVERPMDPRYYTFAARWRDDLARHKPYQEIRRGILDLERLVGETFGLPVRAQPYQAWFDRTTERLQTVADTEPWHEEPPDYIVLVDYLEEERITRLEKPDSGYRLAARIRYENPFGLDVRFSFVNPYVYVFQRENAPGRIADRATP